jgi:hypothetical protein
MQFLMEGNGFVSVIFTTVSGISAGHQDASTYMKLELESGANLVYEAVDLVERYLL